MNKRDVNEEKAVGWGRDVVSSLWCGDSEAALDSLERLSGELSLDLSTNMAGKDNDPRHLVALYHYISNNQRFIVDYQYHQQQGYFISSVFVEKTIDLLICRRMKLRGQNWSRKGADNVVAFRQLVLNDQWQPYWERKIAA